MYLVTVTGGTLPAATGHAPAYAPAAEQAIYSTSDFRVYVICIPYMYHGHVFHV